MGLKVEDSIPQEPYVKQQSESEVVNLGDIF